MNIRARQIETLHALLLKHHEIAMEQEVCHFQAIEQLKKRHLDVQHELESNSQKDYNKRALEQKSKEHALQSKQQPRELRASFLFVFIFENNFSIILGKRSDYKETISPSCKNTNATIQSLSNTNAPNGTQGGAEGTAQSNEGRAE